MVSDWTRLTATKRTFWSAACVEHRTAILRSLSTTSQAGGAVTCAHPCGAGSAGRRCLTWKTLGASLAVARTKELPCPLCHHQVDVSLCLQAHLLPTLHATLQVPAVQAHLPACHQQVDVTQALSAQPLPPLLALLLAVLAHHWAGRTLQVSVLLRACWPWIHQAMKTVIRRVVMAFRSWSTKSTSRTTPLFRIWQLLYMEEVPGKSTMFPPWLPGAAGNW